MTTQNDGMGRQNGVDHGGAGVDDLLAAARAARPLPSDALMARVLADAMAEQPAAGLSLAEAPLAPARVGAGPGRAALRLWQRLVWALGGAGALAGMGTAAVAGLYIGFAQPGGVGGLDEVMLGAPLETVELIPGIDALLMEGN